MSSATFSFAQLAPAFPEIILAAGALCVRLDVDALTLTPDTALARLYGKIVRPRGAQLRLVPDSSSSV